MTLLQTEVGNSRASEPSRKKNRDIALYKTAPLAVDLRERERERERETEYGVVMSALIYLKYILMLDYLMLYTSE